jgi:hypothetical protein
MWFSSLLGIVRNISFTFYDFPVFSCNLELVPSVLGIDEKVDRTSGNFT